MSEKKSYLECIGDKFTRLTVIGCVGQKFLCKCDCGVEKLIYRYDIFNGKTKSCGCYSKEISHINGKKNSKHGMTGTKEYNTWQHIIARCHDSKATGYEDYGKQGVAVCVEWRTTDGFIRFFEHLGSAPSEKHSIDRIDNNKGYEPGNVRWATSKEQCRNKTNNRMITAFGKTKCLVEWSEEVGISTTLITSRLKKGLKPEQALVKKTQEQISEIRKQATRNKVNNFLITAFDKTQCASVWAEEFSIGSGLIINRIKKGYLPEDAISKPSGQIRKVFITNSAPLINGRYRTNTKEYWNWSSMLLRNKQENIPVDPRWMGSEGFLVFLEEVGQSPSEEYKLKLTDKSKGYFPRNVSWATIQDIVSTRKNIVYLTAFGETKSVTSWTKQFGISGSVIKSRIARNWTIEDAVSKPVDISKRKKV